ncbi:hypothetical protein N8A98_15070 [Devosia neptuniae]|uniref:SMODS-associating 2TM beta-strand rich effector domain-containing protein n=1 Tax=Devosia neptuniae TaxID=191302 RepID=A0ABY6C9Q2_9HYPH|nr:hypothetical protein [Devosia neptuniae]UXN68573.1 hypothetical protein N8A98_15070 [Devosia neptuniae]
MYQVLPFRLLVLTFATAALLAADVLEWGSVATGLEMPARWVTSILGALLILLAFKPVWRLIWKLLFLKHIFPDLNGEYEVEIQHNWPIREMLLKSAAEGTPFDPRLPDTVLPPLGVTKLSAKIDLGFYNIRMTMWSERIEDGVIVIDRSRTISTTLIKPCDGHPHRLAYTYQQVNRRETLAASDDAVFEGSAVLNIEDVNSGVLAGQYWTNRAWHRGLSTAGNIKLTRRK